MWMIVSLARVEDIGQLVLYRDYYMAGWGLKEVPSMFSNVFFKTGNSRRCEVITSHIRPRERRAVDAYHGSHEGSRRL